MFIGHFAIAFVLILAFPHVPIWVPLLGVSFPDLLWGILVLLRREEVIVDRNSPLMTSVIFKRYPYSHSLVLANVFSGVVGALLAVGLQNLTVLPIFVLASASHWLLDLVVHLPDLPVLGFDGDKKVGLGLWKWGKTAFVAELSFFAAFALSFVSWAALPWVLIIGLVFHVINANSFLGISTRNPFGSPVVFAVANLLGFGVIAGLFAFIL